MAVSKIANPNLEIITVPIRINNEGATGSGSVKVCGRVATLSAIINPLASGSNLALAWLAGGSSGQYARYAPSDNVWLSCDSYDSGGTRGTAEAKMKSDTYIEFNSPVKNVEFKISGSWITKG